MSSTPFSFSTALELLKLGERVTRESWYSKTIFLVPGSTFQVNRAPLLGIFEEGTTIEYDAHIDVCENFEVGVWSPTMKDILAEDYIVIK